MVGLVQKQEQEVQSLSPHSPLPHTSPHSNMKNWATDLLEQTIDLARTLWSSHPNPTLSTLHPERQRH